MALNESEGNGGGKGREEEELEEEGGGMEGRNGFGRDGSRRKGKEQNGEEGAGNSFSPLEVMEGGWREGEARQAMLLLAAKVSPDLMFLECCHSWSLPPPCLLKCSYGNYSAETVSEPILKNPFFLITLINLISL